MNILNGKKGKTTIALLLVLSMLAPLVAMQNFANAAEIKTYPFVEAVPNPVGVGQRTLINFGLLNFLNVDGDGWNVTLTITDPSGHTQTVGPLKTWSTGTVGYSFLPDTNGTYILKCTFATTNYTYLSYGAPRGGIYAASETEDYELIVTNDAIATYPGHALPSEYWSRPIDSQLREWWSVTGSWVATPNNLYAPYNDAPETPHILWNMPIGDMSGGLMGGDSGDHGYGIGDAYEGKFSGSVIIDGVLYYNRMGSPFYSTVPTQEVVAVDLHTGEVIWHKNLGADKNAGGSQLRLAFAQNLYWDCLNYRGGFAYLYATSGTTWMAFEAENGNWVFNYTNVPSGTRYYGPNGEILQYSIQNLGNATNPNYRLLRWNSSYVVMQGRTGMSESWGSAVQGTTWNAAKYDVNVSIANNLASYSIIRAIPQDRIILGTVTQSSVTLVGLSLVPGSEGALLFSNTWSAPAEWADLTVVGSIGQAGWTAFDLKNYIGTYYTKENRVQYAFSLKTGQFMWQTESSDYKDAWSDTVSLTFGPENCFAYDKFYHASVGGIVYCYDALTGETLWTYKATDPYTESYIGNEWWIIPLFVSDGKIYFGSLEHSALDPKPRGAPFFCLDAETGDLIFRADGLFRQTRWGGRAIIGDSIIATMDTYDQQVYGIGKGPSSMTVSAPSSSVAVDTPVIIQGTVMDISPGTAASDIAMRFPNGVPAVSDASQTEWMLYVYKQFEQPMATTGVPVSIDAVDPNGNYIHLGDVTSDSSGSYSFMYTPELAGKYTVYATFGGSAAYYSSYAQTAMAVAAAPEASATPTPVANPPYELYTIGMGVAIIAAIAVVALLLLRKRP